MSVIHAYIGLGSNLETPLAQIQRAFEELSTVESSQLMGRSALYASSAIGPGQQPDYVNAAALLQTSLEPEALLDRLQAIEQAHRRVRLEHWGPRTLDLDILVLIGSDGHPMTIQSERLTVPHPYLKERNFVLYPLADITPNLTLPDGSTLPALIDQCPPNGIVRLT